MGRNQVYVLKGLPVWGWEEQGGSPPKPPFSLVLGDRAVRAWLLVDDSHTELKDCVVEVFE